MRLTPLIVLLLAGCQITSAYGEPSLIDKVVAMQRRMHARYTGAQRAGLAIVYSDLDRVHREAGEIAAFEEPDVLPEWRPYFDAVRVQADDLAKAPSIAAATRSLAQLGRRCASCHLASVAKIRLPAERLPVFANRLLPTMATHQWAAERLWEGITLPSATRWMLGVDALSRAQLAITAEDESLGVADQAARIHLHARRAARAETIDDRVVIYGDLLSTCVRCHALIRDP